MENHIQVTFKSNSSVVLNAVVVGRDSDSIMNHPNSRKCLVSIWDAGDIFILMGVDKMNPCDKREAEMQCVLEKFVLTRKNRKTGDLTKYTKYLYHYLVMY